MRFWRVKKLEKDLNAANHRIGGLESSLAEKDGRNRALANEKRNLEDQLNDLRKELEKKDKQLLVAKKQVHIPSHSKYEIALPLEWKKWGDGKSGGLRGCFWDVEYYKQQLRGCECQWINCSMKLIGYCEQ